MRELRSIGIAPDMIVARSDYPLEEGLREKMALFCDVDKRAIVSMVTTPILYEVPLLLEQAGVGDYILQRLNLQARRQPDWGEWKELVARVRRNKPIIKIALVGKYVELKDAYISVREALKHATIHLGFELDLRWIN